MPHSTAQVGDLIDEAIETSRSLTAELSPPILRQSGLIAGLEWLAGRMDAKLGLAVRLNVRERIEPLQENITFLLFQVSRELLLNVAKHSGVKSAVIEVTRTSDFIELLVEDEGAGFDPAYITEGGNLKGLGLFSLRERIDMLGGRVEIDSAPGRGSRVRLVVPNIALPADASQKSEKSNVSVVLKSAEAGARVGGERKIRVLLADDQRKMLPVFRDHIARQRLLFLLSGIGRERP